MLARQLLRRCVLPQIIISSRSTQNYASEAMAEADDTNFLFAPHASKKPQGNPFLKTMASGQIDHELLEFPAVHTADRYRDFFFWTRRVASFLEKNEHLPRADLIRGLSNLGVFKGSIDLNYGGFDFSETELCKLIDTLSYVPWLGALVAKSNIPVAKILQAHGSNSVKETYLPKIANGELQPTLCYLESASKWNVENVESICVLSNEEDHWLLNGKKMYVANAPDSNLFLVFAKSTDVDMLNMKYVGDDSMAMFLVEKDLGTMTIEPAKNVVGMKDLQYSTVTFKDTRVPKENMIGDTELGRSVFVDLLAPQNQYTGAQAIGMFKRCLTDLVNFTLSRKYLDKNMHELQMFKVAVGELACELFVMESLMYMTSGLEDTRMNQDVEIERCAANYYCANRCVNNILNCLKIVGPESVYGENMTMNYLNDALPFVTFDINQESTKNLLALLAVKHYSKGHKDVRTKQINRFERPGSILETLFRSTPQNMYNPGLLHPTLKPGVTLLPKIAHRLNSAMNLVVYRYGKKVAQQQVECCKLGDMLVHSYAIVTTLSRASRSYCIGLRNAEHDVNMALIFTIRAYRIIEKLYEDIDNGSHVSGITYLEKVADELFAMKGYCVADPLERNW